MKISCNSKRKLISSIIISTIAISSSISPIKSEASCWKGIKTTLSQGWNSFTTGIRKVASSLTLSSSSKNSNLKNQNEGIQNPIFVRQIICDGGECSPHRIHSQNRN